MKFFVPGAKDEVQAERLYQVGKSLMETHFGPLGEARYCEVEYLHNGEMFRSRVGEPHQRTGEVVCAIFRSGGPQGCFLICTPNRGWLRGNPILAGDGEMTRASEFSE